MIVRAKFKVDSIHDDPADDGITMMASPVIDGSEENKSFAQYTPSGSMHLWINRTTPAHTFFKPGMEFYIDMSPADASAPGDGNGGYMEETNA